MYKEFYLIAAESDSMADSKKNHSNNTKNEIIIYQTEDGNTKIDVRLADETVWLTQAQLCEL